MSHHNSIVTYYKFLTEPFIMIIQKRNLPFTVDTILQVYNFTVA